MNPSSSAPNGDPPSLALIAALARNGVIGQQNRLPWRLPGELAYFKAVTWGHPVIMGRKTYESIGKPLPGRQNIIVTRQPDYAVPGTESARSLPQALALARDEELLFVIGGGELFQQALPLASRLYLTEIDADVDGDAWFPERNPADWREIKRERPPQPASPYPFEFVVYERVAAG